MIAPASTVDDSYMEGKKQEINFIWGIKRFKLKSTVLVV